MAKDTYEEVVDLCRHLYLYGVIDHIKEVEAESLGYDDFLQKLLTYQIKYSEKKFVENKIRNAKFPTRKYLDELDTSCLPSGIKTRLPELMDLDFVRNGQNLILTGNPGTGKTHVAIGLGIKACQQGYRVLFVSLPSLVTELRECYTGKSLLEFEKRFEKYDLVIVDELGYVSFNREGADLVFNCLSRRAVSKSTIITSNLSFSRWGEVFGDVALTTALVDRLAYRAILVDMTGESYRYHETAKELNQQQSQTESTG